MSSTNNFFKEKKQWSKLKDQLLENYLIPYLTKIKETKKPITIIDCFAGKGKFDDDGKGSPLIILDDIKKVKNKHNTNIKAIFIEKKYYEDLKNNLSNYDNYRILKGSFEENIDSILNLNSNQNILFYIDPYGIKSLDFEYFVKLINKKFYSVELLLNFNSFGFLREAFRILNYDIGYILEDSNFIYENEDVIGKSYLTKIANGSYWVDLITKKYTDNKSLIEIEEQLIKEYIQKIRQLFSYVINISIKEKLAHIPKYRIIYATNHKDGLIIMANQMNKVWNEFVNIDSGGQLSLIKTDYSDYELMKTGKINIEDFINKLINNGKIIKLEDLYIAIFEKYGISYNTGYYNKILKNMEKKNIIFIDRVPEVTKTGRKTTSMNYKKFEITIRLI